MPSLVTPSVCEGKISMEANTKSLIDYFISESCKTPLTISFWLQPIGYRDVQSYITAFTPSPMGGQRSVSWAMIFDNNLDQFNFTMSVKKLQHNFTLNLDFMLWSHVMVTVEDEIRLYVNGEEQTAYEWNPSYAHPYQPFSYLEIGTTGEFQIDDIQFYASVKLPSELYCKY